MGPYRVIMRAYASFLGPNGSYASFMDSNGSLLVPIGPYSSQWILMATNESS